MLRQFVTARLLEYLYWKYKPLGTIKWLMFNIDVSFMIFISKLKGD